MLFELIYLFLNFCEFNILVYYVYMVFLVFKFVIIVVIFKFVGKVLIID